MAPDERSGQSCLPHLRLAGCGSRSAHRRGVARRGVEVWFDQNEIVGGDAWDAKIRQQIKDCSLFVPIISAATQARAEGYFRLEWRLADQRTHLMGKSRSFLLPGVH
ncbi:MAG: toll/interleukin-1 receptor domain-containing protein [Opitutaceae bacterium]